MTAERRYIRRVPTTPFEMRHWKQTARNRRQMKMMPMMQSVMTALIAMTDLCVPSRLVARTRSYSPWLDCCWSIRGLP